MWNDPVWSWNDIAQQLATEPDGTTMIVYPYQVEPPKDAGMLPSLGVPAGQRSDYRLDFEGGVRLVVSDFGQHYHAMLQRPAAIAALEAVLRDSPGSTVAGMTALGALVGLALGRSAEAALAGAAIGGMAGLGGVAVANADTAPEVADVSATLLRGLVQSMAEARRTEEAQRKSRSRTSSAESGAPRAAASRKKVAGTASKKKASTTRSRRKVDEADTSVRRLQAASDENVPAASKASPRRRTTRRTPAKPG